MDVENARARANGSANGKCKRELGLELNFGISPINGRVKPSKPATKQRPGTSRALVGGDSVVQVHMGLMQMHMGTLA